MFSSPASVPTMNLKNFNKKISAENLKKNPMVTPRIFSIFLAKFFLWDLYVLTIGYD